MLLSGQLALQVFFLQRCNNMGWQAFSVKGQINTWVFVGHLCHNDSTLLMVRNRPLIIHDNKWYCWFPIKFYHGHEHLNLTCFSWNMKFSWNITLLLILCSHLKMKKIILRLQAMEKQAAKLIWPMGCSLSILLRASSWLFSLMYRKWSPKQQGITKSLLFGFGIYSVIF